MHIQKMSLKEFWLSLSEAISIGKKYYLVLLVCSAVMAGVNLVLSDSVFGSILAPLFSVIWAVGIIYIAQTVIEKNQEPKVSQFFVAFSKNSLLKAIVPNLIIILILALVELMIMASVSVLFYFLPMQTLMPFLNTTMMTAATMFMATIAVLTMLPVMFVPYLLILQKNDWKQALKLSILGTLKNKTISLSIILPTLAFIAVLEAITLLVGPNKDGARKFLEISLESSKNVFQFLSFIAAPYFMMLTYILYKRIFVSEKFDQNLELAP